MKSSRSSAHFRKIIVPVIHDCQAPSAITAAQTIAGDGVVLLVGLVRVEPGQSLSTAAQAARLVRERLKRLQTEDERLRTRARVFVSHTPWTELVHVIEEEQPDLLILEWTCHFDAMCISAAEALAHPPCDVALVRGPFQKRPSRVLLPIRGGPYAELALRLSLSIVSNQQNAVTALHLIPPGSDEQQDAPFRGLANILPSLLEVDQQQWQSSDPVGTILDRSPEFDLVVMGSTAQHTESAPKLGPVAERILEDSPSGVIVVKTSQPAEPDLDSEAAGQTAISVLVDKWFAENTFHAEEFTNLNHLLAYKQRQNLKISLALPALNEEATVGNVIQTIKRALMDQVPLLDEIVLIDSDSTDRTREIAASLDVPTYIHQRMLPDYGARVGKGEALWKSLYATEGDIVLWIDTDIVNIHPRFVYGLLGPLLANPRIQFVKGFYRRPIKVGDKIQAGGGGRVTELTARPLLNLFYPELSGLVQPLSGEYGGRRSALEQLSFFSGYGVEIGLLIDVFEKCGLSAIAQVDLDERIHHNQSLESLSKMSFAIIQTVIQRLERRYGRSILEEVNKTMKLIRYEQGHFFLDVVEIAEPFRPPMIELPEYQQIWAR